MSRPQGKAIGYPVVGVTLQQEATDVKTPSDAFPVTVASKKWIAPEVHALSPDVTLDVSPPNARALPDVECAIHAVEGPDRVYYFGMVDWFMEYGFNERCRRVKKTIKYFSDDHSTVPPRKYAKRMLQRTFDSMR